MPLSDQILKMRTGVRFFIIMQKMDELLTLSFKGSLRFMTLFFLILEMDPFKDKTLQLVKNTPQFFLEFLP